MSKIKELQKKMKDLKAEMKKEGRGALKEAFKELFESHPVLEAVQWEQYTPYFNDGDSCTFSVNDMYPVFVLTEDQKKILGDEADTEDAGELWYDFEYGDLKKTMTPEQKAASKALTKLVKDLGDMDDTLEDLFGDHVAIRATKRGFTVKVYEHD
jgi:hypothetical protein